MKDRILLPEAGLYKANLHCHTTLSDGRHTPEEIKELYKARGYSIVAFTDHCRYGWHRELDDDGFLALAALEADLTEDGDDWPRLRTYHLNLFDTRPSDSRGELDLLPHCSYHDRAGVNGYIKRMNELGFLVCYNHPYWSLQDVTDYCGLEGLFAMEIYNHGCQVEGLYGFHQQAYDEMLRSGQRLHALATDDNHNGFAPDSPEYDSFGGCVYIAAERLGYQEVISALRSGSLYWSTGPKLLGVQIKDGELRVKCSPVEKIFVVQEGRNYYRRQVNPGETITEARFPLSGSEGWFRIEVRDARGMAAGTGAFFTDELG